MHNSKLRAVSRHSPQPRANNATRAGADIQKTQNWEIFCSAEGGSEQSLAALIVGFFAFALMAGREARLPAVHPTNL
jgi:hypothetical protein